MPGGCPAGAEETQLTNQEPDATWAALGELDDTERQKAMSDRFHVLEEAPPDERRRDIGAMVSAEDAMDDESIYPFALSRLRVWAQLAREDLPKAQSIASAYDEVYAEGTGTAAWRRATVVQTIARLDLSADDIDALSDLVPSLMRQIPRARTTILERGADEAEAVRARRAAAPLWRRILGR